MRDLSWVRIQGRIIEKEKKRMRRKRRDPIKTKLDSFSELYEIFEKRFKDTAFLFQEKRYSAKIELQNREKMLNTAHR